MNSLFRRKEHNDAEIIKILQKSSEEQEGIIDLLYIRCYFSVKKYVTSNGGTPEDAKDVFQDSMLMFYRRVKENRIDSDTKIKAYLYNTASNKWRNILKKRNRKMTTNEFETANENSAYETPFEIMHNKEKEVFVNQLIDKLDEKCQLVLKMVVYQKKPMKDVAQKLGYKNEQIARNKQYKCIEKLKVIINDSLDLMAIANSMR